MINDHQLSPTKESLDCFTNSPHQHLEKCIENRRENMYTDVRAFKGLNKKSLLGTIHNMNVQ